MSDSELKTGYLYIIANTAWSTQLITRALKDYQRLDRNSIAVLSLSADGQFISSFGSKGSQHGQLNYPLGICIDSTNTVYVTDDNHRVSVYTRIGQLINCFSTKGTGEERET